MVKGCLTSYEDPETSKGVSNKGRDKMEVCTLQVFGVTHDPFIVWTSNMAAILSLRALYSFVATVLSKLRFLDKSVAAALAWIGIKMILDFIGVHVSIEASLGVVATSIGAGVAASLWYPGPEKSQDESDFL